MKRVRIVVAYDGTDYCGWQIQPNGVTIEEVLNKCLKALTGEEIRVIGASRTDSGVHALGNVAVFDTESRIPPELPHCPEAVHSVLPVVHNRPVVPHPSVSAAVHNHPAALHSPAPAHSRPAVTHIPAAPPAASASAAGWTPMRRP